MRIIIGSIIITLLLSGCRGFYPSSVFPAPPSAAPLRHRGFAPEGSDGRPYSPAPVRSLSAGADYSGGTGTRPEESYQIFRGHFTISNLHRSEDAVSRTSVGGILLRGTVTGRGWNKDTSFALIPTSDPRSAIGIGAYGDFNTGLVGSSTAVGIGATVMVGLEGGEYASVWHAMGNWPFPVVFQLGGYVFLDSRLSSETGLWLRTGLSLASPFYFDGGFYYGKFGASFGGNYLLDTYDGAGSMRLHGGISYQL